MKNLAKLIIGSLSALLVISSCTTNNTKEQKVDEYEEGKVYSRKDNYEGGGVRSEYQFVIDSLDKTKLRRHGLTKNYSVTGRITESTHFNYGYKDGVCKKYYQDGETLWQVKHYVKGKLDGIYEKYDRNGKLKAKVTYKAGLMSNDLVEFTSSGTEYSKYPKLIVEKKNEISSRGKYVIKAYLSNKSKKAQFFVGNLMDGKFFHKNLRPVSVHNGVAEFEVTKSEIEMLNKKFSVVCKYKTRYGNYKVYSNKTVVKL